MKWTDEQRKVIDARDKNILVSAAAGSGKTAVLVERILELISEGEAPLNVDELLVVTFTRAAAAQMKDRLMRALEDRLETDPDNEHLQKQITLIHHAQITTIDGFCSYVIRSYFQQIDLDPGARVADEGEQKLLMQDTLEEVLETAYEEKDPDFLSLAGALDSGKSDEGLEQTVLKLFTLSQSHPWPEVWLEECLLPYTVTDTEGMSSQPWLYRLEELTKALVQQAVELNEKAVEVAAAADGPQQYTEALESDHAFMDGLLEAKGYDAMQKLLQGWKPKALSRKSSDKVSEAKKLQVQDLRKQEKDILQEKLAKTYYADSLERLCEKMQQSAPVVRGLVRLTKQYARRFSEIKREKNLLDFNDVEHLALQVLLHREEDGTETATDAARELSGRYAQIMIDEYQDSNLVQEKILTAVSREREGVHNLFMVGDVKQSIYKFRLARPELFLEKYETYAAGGQECQRIDLHRNFRSRPEVLDSVNTLFRRIMTKALGGISYDTSVYLYPGVDWSGKEDEQKQTELLLIEKDTEEAQELESAREVEAVMVADRIRRMVGKEQILDKETGEYRAVRYGDIVILLRSIKGWAEVFGRVLKERKIPADSLSKVGYFSAPEVVAVLQYLRILDNPRQDMAMAAVLVSPIVGLSSEDMALVKLSAPEEALCTCVMQYPEKAYADSCLAEKIRKFRTIYTRLREKISYTSVREILTQLYDQTGYLSRVTAMPAGEQRRANLMMLVEKAAEYEKSSYSGLFHFIRYIDSLKKYEVDFGEAQSGSRETDLVRIMSIHNSKGLEFPVVITAGLGKNFNVTDTRQMVTLHPDLGIGLPCIHPTERTKEETLYHRLLQTILREETLGEELRILYVALTRAEQKLILTGTLSKADKKLQEVMDMAESADMPLSYGRLIFASSALDWILQALGGSEALALLARERQAASVTVYTGQTQKEKPVRIRMVTVEELLEAEMTEQLGELSAREQIEQLDEKTIYDPDTRKKLEEKLDAVYPYADLADMPAKLSVSDLKLKQYEEEQGHQLFEEPETVPCIPAFMQGKDTTVSGGAQRGTAYHRMMECLEYEKARKGMDIPSMIRELKDRGFLSEEDAGMLRAEDFETFLASELGQEMSAAEAKGKLYRERQFFLTVEAKEADPKWKDSQSMILVQGIIDAYYETEEGLVLVDYKTDRVQHADGQDLIDKYKVQLQYYAEALMRLTGKPVVKKLIYSFALHRVLPV